MWFRIRLMADEDRIIYESIDYDMKMMMTFSIITRHWFDYLD